jgi:hypothetical protein
MSYQKLLYFLKSITLIDGMKLQFEYFSIHASPVHCIFKSFNYPSFVFDLILQ